MFYCNRVYWIVFRTTQCMSGTHHQSFTAYGYTNMLRCLANNSSSLNLYSTMLQSTMVLFISEIDAGTPHQYIYSIYQDTWWSHYCIRIFVTSFTVEYLPRRELMIIVTYVLLFQCLYLVYVRMCMCYVSLRTDNTNTTVVRIYVPVTLPALFFNCTQHAYPIHITHPPPIFAPFHSFPLVGCRLKDASTRFHCTRRSFGRAI